MTYDPFGPVRPPDPPETSAASPDLSERYLNTPAPVAPAQPPAPAPVPAPAPAPAASAPAPAPAPRQNPDTRPVSATDRSHGVNGQSFPVASYPGYGAPPPPAEPPPSAGSLPSLAMSVSVSSVFVSWIPAVGALAALGGLVLSIRSARRRGGRVLGVIGAVVSSLAGVVGLLVTLGYFSSLFPG